MFGFVLLHLQYWPVSVYQNVIPSKKNPAGLDQTTSDLVTELEFGSMTPMVDVVSRSFSHRNLISRPLTIRFLSCWMGYSPTISRSPLTGRRPTQSMFMILMIFFCLCSWHRRKIAGKLSVYGTLKSNHSVFLQSSCVSTAWWMSVDSELLLQINVMLESRVVRTKLPKPGRFLGNKVALSWSGYKRSSIGLIGSSPISWWCT